MKKKLLLAVFILIGGLMLVACGPKGGNFKLVIDGENVTTDVLNLEEIAKETQVTLTINVPEGMELDTFTVNGVDKKAEIKANKYVFKITEDTTVKVTYKDKGNTPEEKFVLTLENATLVAPKDLDLQAVLKGTEVEIKPNEAPAGQELSQVLVNDTLLEANADGKYLITINQNTTVKVTYKEQGSQDITYALTLPTGVTSNQADNAKILENTEVILTLDVPADHEIVKLLLNDEDVTADIVDNTYTFTITKDVTVVYETALIKPRIVGKIVHWMPGAIDDSCSITAELDLKGAETVKFYLNDNTTELNDLVDYEINGTEIKFYPSILDGLALGEHAIHMKTEKGDCDLAIHIVESPVGTTIPTKTVKGVNMSGVEAYMPTAVIPDAPKLLITEIQLDSRPYDYIEVFNNTNEPYNLKNHRIVYADLANNPLITDGLLAWAHNGTGGVLIYQDYIIPALTSAIIWVISETTFGVDTKTRVLSVLEDSFLIGPKPNQLSIAKFKERYQIPEEGLVFPTRTQFAHFNNTASYDPNTGLGIAVSRVSSKTGNPELNWASNSKTDNRGVQIQYVDTELKIPVETPTASMPADTAYYKYEVGVKNPEETIIVDGVLDSSKIEKYGGRESVNAVYYNPVYYDASDNRLGYALDGKGQIDGYNNKPTDVPFTNFAKAVLKPVATAIFYPRLVEETPGTVVFDRWYKPQSAEYMLPKKDGIAHLFRFIPRQTDLTYDQVYATNDPLRDLKLSGIAPSTIAVPEVLETQDVIVPVNPQYPTNYLAEQVITAGRTCGFNFLREE